MMVKPDIYHSKDGLKHGEGFRVCEEYFGGAPCDEAVKWVVHHDRHRETMRIGNEDRKITVMEESFLCDIHFHHTWRKKDSAKDGFTVLPYEEYLEQTQRDAKKIARENQ
jgi:hypothetical protein